MAADFDTAEPPEQVQCEVTGRRVPADETVVIQGLRVCAEGKQILLERLRSGALITGELERPSVFSRIGAILVDSVCLAIGGIIVLICIGVVYFESFPGQRKSDADMFAVIISATMGMVQIVYFVYFHGRYGQTPGKMVAKICVRKADGSPIGYRTAAARALLFVGPNLVRDFIEFVLWDTRDLAGTQVIGAVTAVAVSVYFITSVVAALIDRTQQRALHDRFAGTRVVVV